MTEQTNKSDRVVSSHDFYQALKKLPEVKLIKFGIKGIDNVLGGFALGDLITVSGFTGFGKTTLAQTISFNLGQQDITTIWFSYELTSRQFFNKYTEDNVPLFYLPINKKPYDINWIEEKIIEAKSKFNIQAAFIDHLHYVVPMATNSNVKQNRGDIVGDAMRTLKLMAVKHNVAIFLMAHTKQPKDNNSPVIGDLRDSSFVGQESDIILIMHRPSVRGKRDEYENYGTCTIAKQRDGGHHGKIKLEVHNNMFYDPINLEDEKE